MVAGCPLFAEEERGRLVESLEPFDLSLDGGHLSSLWAHYRRAMGEGTPVELLDLTTTEFLRVGNRYSWAYEAAFRFEAERLLPQVRCPTLFLVTQGDRLRGKNERAVELTPNAEGRVIDSPYGQYAARDPEGFAREVLAVDLRASGVRSLAAAIAASFGSKARTEAASLAKRHVMRPSPQPISTTSFPAKSIKS